MKENQCSNCYKPALVECCKCGKEFCANHARATAATNNFDVDVDFICFECQWKDSYLDNVWPYVSNVEVCPW